MENCFNLILFPSEFPLLAGPKARDPPFKGLDQSISDKLFWLSKTKSDPFEPWLKENYEKLLEQNFKVGRIKLFLKVSHNSSNISGSSKCFQCIK